MVIISGLTKLVYKPCDVVEQKCCFDVIVRHLKEILQQNLGSSNFLDYNIMYLLPCVFTKRVVHCLKIDMAFDSFHRNCIVV